MKNVFSRALLPFSLAALAASSAYADVAFNDFGAGDSFNTSAAWNVNGQLSGAGTVQPATQFTSATSGTLSSVTIALSYVSGPNIVNVTLLSDTGSDQVGTSLESWSLTNLPNFGTSFTPQVLTGDGSVSLTSGTKYWLLATPGDPHTSATWNFNDQGATGLRAFSQDNGASYTYVPNSTDGAFRVETTPVPEPATLSVLCLGLLGLLKRRR